MASILTNVSAMTALQSLNATNKKLEQTQGRISTGLRVATAEDNAAYWSIATTMRSDNKVNSVVQDALGLGAGKIDTAYTVLNSVLHVVDDIKAKVLLAKTSSPEDRAKIQSEINSLQNQLRDSVGGATYAGANLLQTDSASTDTDLTIISSYNRDANGAVVTGSIQVAYASMRLIDSNATAADAILDRAFATEGSATASILDLKVSGTGGVSTQTGFDNMLTGIEAALQSIANAAAELGAAKSQVEMQKAFVSKLMDSIDRGVGQLVDADMNKESTRLQALQVQQQLGIQALSIANANAQNILSLFRS